MIKCFVVITLTCVLLFGCASHRQNAELAAETVLGRWESQVGTGEWGRSMARLDFDKDGKMTFRAVFVDESPPKEITHNGTFRFDGKKLVLDEMNRGEPLRAWFDHGDLMLQTGAEAPARLHRVH